MKKLILILVTLLTAISVNAEIAKWDASEGATGYIIYLNEYSKDVGNVTEYQFNVVPGVLNTLYVKAYNECGLSEPSNTVEYTKEVFIPIDNPWPPITVTKPGTTVITITVDSN